MIGNIETPVSLPGQVEHGSPNAYNNYGCRCPECKLAWRNYQLDKVAKRKARGLPDPLDERHGTYSGYANYGCREERCVEANRLYALDYQVRKGNMTVEKAISLGWVENG